MSSDNTVTATQGESFSFVIGLPPPPASKGVSGFVRRLIDVFHPNKK